MATSSNPRGGRLVDNGALVHKVDVKVGRYRGHRLTFTQHSPDRFTVFGLCASVTDGISIERRKQETQVLMHESSAAYTLQDCDQWIAYSVNAGSYYGALAVGATAQDAYERSFNQFNR